MDLTYVFHSMFMKYGVRILCESINAMILIKSCISKIATQVFIEKPNAFYKMKKVSLSPNNGKSLCKL